MDEVRQGNAPGRKAAAGHAEEGRQGPLERYLTILEMVAASHRGLSLTDIATLTGLPKPTVHRLTRVLLDADALVSDDSRHKTFRIGPRMWRLLHLGLDRDTVASYAQIVCDNLAAKLHETCYIVRLGREHVRSVARSAPDQGHRLHVLPGAELPPHAASSAKAILAFQSDDVVNRILREPLPALTSRTKISIEAVKAELEEVRRQGYAVCDREIDDNIMAYACPVHLDSVGVLYSVGVTGPCSRLRQHPTMYWIAAAQEAAAQFATMLATLKR